MSRKFQEQNLGLKEEEVRDGSIAVGLAAVCEFRNSEYFPSNEDLKESVSVYGNHNKVLLESFKSWVVC